MKNIVLTAEISALHVHGSPLLVTTQISAKFNISTMKLLFAARWGSPLIASSIVLSTVKLRHSVRWIIKGSNEHHYAIFHYIAASKSEALRKWREQFPFLTPAVFLPSALCVDKNSKGEREWKYSGYKYFF